LRSGFAPLWLRHFDIRDAVERLATIMDSDIWHHPRFAARQAVN
jgi:kynureninase